MKQTLPMLPVIATVNHQFGVGRLVRNLSFGVDNGTSTVWTSANLAYFFQFHVTEPWTVDRIFVMNGGAVSGNIDVGIYSEDGTLIVSKGSTAQSGTSANQSFDITNTTLGPGVYYLAIAMDNTTGTTLILNGGSPSVSQCRMSGVYQMASAFPLPATATFATCTTAYIPYAGISTRSFV